MKTRNVTRNYAERYYFFTVDGSLGKSSSQKILKLKLFIKIIKDFREIYECFMMGEMFSQTIRDFLPL